MGSQQSQDRAFLYGRPFKINLILGAWHPAMAHIEHDAAESQGGTNQEEPRLTEVRHSQYSAVTRRRTGPGPIYRIGVRGRPMG